MWPKNIESENLGHVKMEKADFKNNMDTSADSKVKEQNRIRQLAFKARQNMPKDYGHFVKWPLI